MKQGYLSEIFVSFQGEGAHVGRRHLFVRLAGCNLRCSYCDTPDSLERTADYTVSRRDSGTVRLHNPVSAGELSELVVSMIAAEGPIDAVALTGGEPLTQSEFLADALDRGGFSVPVLLETNGMLPQRLPPVLPHVDIVSMDIKLPSNSGEGAFWEEHAHFISLARVKDLYVKILVDQGTRTDEVVRAASLVGAFEPVVPTFLQPIVDSRGTSTIDGERLTDLYLAARRHLDSIRVLPQTHKLLGIR